MARDARQPGPDIILLGHGVSDTLQLTVEAQNVLVRVGKVYALSIPPNLARHLKSLRVQCVDLSGGFAEGKPYSDAYLDAAAAVLKRTADERPVVLLVQGNPLFLNAVSRFLVMQARERKLSVKVYPGVSQLDALITEIGLDVSTFGLQMFDATRLVAREHRINPHVPLLILQLVGFGAESIRPAGRNAGEFERLIDYLARFYPPQQSVVLLNTANGAGPAAARRAPLNRFAELVELIGPSSSLFIDSVRQRQSAQPP